MLDIIMLAAAAWAFSCCRSATPTPATGFEENDHDFRLRTRRSRHRRACCFYLTYALLRPERF